MRLALIAVVAWTALADSWPTVARADAPAGLGDLADKPEGGHEGGADKEHAKRPGEVEEGLFAGALDLALWTIVVFLVLYFVLRTYAWGPIATGLDRRERAIAADKHEAEAAKAEAARLREHHQAELAKAHDQVRQLLDKARQDAEALAAERETKGKADLQAERDRLHRELGMERDQARMRIWTEAVQLATLISTKAVKRQLSETDHRQLLDESLAEFRQALAARREDIESAQA
jgi:F-type H+-transporting ATPase subunit b